MWQGWIAFLDGIWVTLSSFYWHTQTNINLLIAGIVLAVFGFLAKDSWEGVVLGFIGIWLIGSGLTNYLVLSINFFLTGLTIIPIALMCATIRLRPKLISNFK